MHRNIIKVGSVQLAILSMSVSVFAQREATKDVSATASTDSSADDLSATLAALVERHGLPGMAAVVVHDSRIVASGVAGVRRRGDTAPITIHDRFHLGSETKSMTATLCAQLVEAGKLEWGTTLGQAFPELCDRMLSPYRDITLAQLLTHRTGIRQTIDPADTKDLVAFVGTPTAARRMWLERVIRQKPEVAVGTQFIYSNTNYVVAGHMIETIMSRPYEELMQEELFAPLGMTSAGFGAPGRADVLNEPRGHTASGDAVEPCVNADNPQVYAPSGTVHASLLDWAKFTDLHATLGESHPRLISRESFDILHGPISSASGEPKVQEVAPGSLGYAMGWFVFPKRVLAHTGTNLRWFADCAVIPDARLSGLVTCNQGGDKAETACHEALQNLISEYYRRTKAAELRPNASENR